jgi:hypothetical protein
VCVSLERSDFRAKGRSHMDFAADRRVSGYAENLFTKRRVSAKGRGALAGKILSLSKLDVEDGLIRARGPSAL